MAVNFGAQLQRFARGVRSGRPCVQHRAAIAKAGDTCAVEQMGVNAGNLRRAVSAQTHHAARDLVHQFEGLQIERFAGASKQRLQVFQERRHDQFVAIAARHVQQIASDFFDVARLRRQHIGNMIRKDPSGHGLETLC